MSMHMLKFVVDTNDQYVDTATNTEHDFFDIPTGDIVCTPDGNFKCCECGDVKLGEDVESTEGCLDCDIWRNMENRVRWCRMLACTPASRHEMNNVIFKRTFEKCEAQKGGAI